MAIATIKLQGRIDEGFRTEIDCSHKFIVDQPKAGGGNDEGPNPMEIFLSALPACICAIGRIVARQQRIEVRSMEVKVEGDINKDYLMGKTTEGRAGFTEIRTFIDVDADMTHEEKVAFIEEVERRCPIADNIINSSNVVTTIVNPVSAN